MKPADAHTRFLLQLDICDQAMSVARMAFVSPIARRVRDRYLADEIAAPVIMLPGRAS